jgi:hypothetical protein
VREIEELETVIVVLAGVIIVLPGIVTLDGSLVMLAGWLLLELATAGTAMLDSQIVTQKLTVPLRIYALNQGLLYLILKFTSQL